MEIEDSVSNDIDLSIREFTNQFSDELSAKKYMEKIRWSRGRHCPHCGSACTLPIKSENPMPYRCQSCREHFSVRTGTIIAESNVPLHKWLFAIYLMTTACPDISSIQLAKKIGVTQKTAWSMKGRIQLAYEAYSCASGAVSVKITGECIMPKDKQPNLSGRFDLVMDAVLVPVEPAKPKASNITVNGAAAEKSPSLRTYIDLFCGIGGFHVAASNLGLQCLFASDIDPEVRKAYGHNFGIEPHGDITRIDAAEIPDHDLLCGGFPCQPFSIIGSRQGFSDPRGTMFFEIERIVEAKRPKAILLENVRQLASINKGETLGSIVDSLKQLGYYVDYRILNALNFGVPQKRERLLIVGTRKDIGQFPWPKEKVPMTPLSAILEEDPDPKHFVSERIKLARQDAHTAKIRPAIWHENKSGNVSSHPFSCALRAGASYNYLLVDGERRLTPREMLRLQGFPDTFEIVCTDSQTRKQAGNSVPVPMIQAIMERLVNVYR